MNKILKNTSYFNKKGVSCLIQLGIKINPFPNSEDALEIINSYERGIRWEYLGNRIEIFNDTFVSGYPSCDLNSFIAIYPINSNKLPAPRNAAVLNADGSIRFQLNPPELISKHALERLNEVEIREKKGLWFENVRWNKDTDGNTVTSMWIGFNMEWFEERVINPATGKFGECLASGRL